MASFLEGLDNGLVELDETFDLVDEACADKPYQTIVQVIEANSTKNSTFATSETDSEGRFTIMLPPGEYRLQALGGSPLPSCDWQTITIKTGVVHEVNLSCDTGIR